MAPTKIYLALFQINTYIMPLVFLIKHQFFINTLQMIIITIYILIWLVYIRLPSYHIIFFLVSLHAAHSTAYGSNLIRKYYKYVLFFYCLNFCGILDFRQPYRRTSRSRLNSILTSIILFNIKIQQILFFSSMYTYKYST